MAAIVSIADPDLEDRLDIEATLNTEPTEAVQQFVGLGPRHLLAALSLLANISDIIFVVEHTLAAMFFLSFLHYLTRRLTGQNAVRLPVTLALAAPLSLSVSAASFCACTGLPT